MTARHGFVSGLMLILLATSGLSAPPASPLPVDWNTGSGFQDGGFTGFVNDMMLASDGSGDLYVGGRFQSFNGVSRNRITRLNSDGSLDTSFDVGTGLVLSFHPQCEVNRFAPGPAGSGDVYVGGRFDLYKGAAANYLVRLNSDGSVDTAFATGTGFNGVVHSLASTPDDDLYVAGVFTTYQGAAANYLVRLNSDGTVDTGFDLGAGLTSGISRMWLASDGSGDVYLNGGGSLNGTAINGLVRLNSDGTIDTAFNVGTGFNNGVMGLVPAPDGSGDIYAGGWFTSYNGTAANHIVRLNSDGTVDTSFNVGSGFTSNAVVSDLAATSDGSGDVFVGGQFREYAGVTRNHIVRLNSDGTLDSGFNLGSQLNNSVLRTLLTPDGTHLFVGGAFYGVPGNCLARVDTSVVMSPTWDTGDLFAAIQGNLFGNIPQCRVFTSSGDFKDDAFQPGPSNRAVACSFNPDHSKLYATVLTNSTVVVFDPIFPHPIVQTINTGAQSPGGSPESIVFAANGGFYVGHNAGDKDLHRYNAAGVFQQKYNVAVENAGSDQIELAKDQKTMFYTSEGRKIFRYNVLTGAQMKDFAKLPGNTSQGTLHALRLLPPGDGTGGLLVADRLNIKRLNGSGTVVMTYDATNYDGTAVDSWTYLALDSNGTSFWAASSNRIYRFNIASGALEAGGLPTMTNAAFGLCVKGAFRAAID